MMDSFFVYRDEDPPVIRYATKGTDALINKFRSSLDQVDIHKAIKYHDGDWTCEPRRSIAKACVAIGMAAEEAAQHVPSGQTAARVGELLGKPPISKEGEERRQLWLQQEEKSRNCMEIDSLFRHHPRLAQYAIFLRVLGYHAAIEQRLIAAIERFFEEPAQFDSTRLNFPQKVDLLRALVGRVPDEEIWDLVLQFNRLRNIYAHGLPNVKKLDDLLRELRLAVVRSVSGSDGMTAKSRDTLCVLVLSYR